MRGRRQGRTAIERLREHRWQRPRALWTGGELTSKANLDQSEFWVVPATVRAKAFKAGFTKSITVQETFIVEE